MTRTTPCEFFGIIMELPLRHHDARGVSLALIALSAASLLRGTHPAHAARRARVPAASTPHAPAPDTTHERRRTTTTKRCCVPSRAQSRRHRSVGYARSRVPPRQRGPVARAGRFLPPPMRAWLEQPHGRHHKAPPQPCALTTSKKPRCRILRITCSGRVAGRHASFWGNFGWLLYFG